MEITVLKNEIVSNLLNPFENNMNVWLFIIITKGMISITN